MPPAYCYLLAFPFVVLYFLFLKMVSSCQGEMIISRKFFLQFDHWCWFHFPFPFPFNSEHARIDPDGREITIGTFFNDKVVSKHHSLLLCNSLRIIYEESRFENGHCSIYVACLQRVVENMFTMPRCHTLLWLRPNNSHFALTPEWVAADAAACCFLLKTEFLKRVVAFELENVLLEFCSVNNILIEQHENLTPRSLELGMPHCSMSVIKVG